MIRILSQKSAAVDSSGRWMRDWFTVIGDIINGINKSRVTWSGKRITYTGATAPYLATTIGAQAGNTGLMRLVINTATTNSANAKSVQVKVDDVLVITADIAASTEEQVIDVMVAGSGASLQYCSASGSNCTISQSGQTSIDMSGNSTVGIYLIIADSTDSISLESWALYVEQQ